MDKLIWPNLTFAKWYMASRQASRTFCRAATLVMMMGSGWFGLGCSEADIEQYTVPKGSERIAEERAGDAPQQLEPAGRADGERPAESRAAEPSDPTTIQIEAEVGWVLPEGWRLAEQRHPMRVATFMVDDEAGPVELAVTRFAGDVGGPVANVNRWRGQLGMEPIGESEVHELLTPFENPGFKGHLLHLRGPQQHMLAASIHEPSKDRTWFVRVVDSEAVVQRVKPEVVAFARSFGTADESQGSASQDEGQR